jgi:DNA-binding transcriptional ArsR family regulator
VAARLGRRILLFTENLDMILGEQFSDDWGIRRLRDFLMNGTALLWVASAPTVFAEVDDAERPLFKLFRIERVEDLSRDDLLDVLLERARYDAPVHPAAKRLAEGSRRERARLQAVLHLTGGSPRLALMLYQVALRGKVHEAQQELGGLLDQLSPYFQERMRALSPQRRKIVQALADSDGVLTPTQIAGRARVGEPKQVVAQLGKLLDLGWVTRPRQGRSKETYYTLREVLFRYWHQWRTAPNRRTRMTVFVEFLTLFYGAEELEDALTSSQQALAQAHAMGEARFITSAGTTVAYLEAARERVVQRTAEEEQHHRQIETAAEAWKQGNREPALRLFADNPVFQLALQVERGDLAIDRGLARAEEPIDLEPTADAALDANDITDNKIMKDSQRK